MGWQSCSALLISSCHQPLRAQVRPFTCMIRFAPSATHSLLWLLDGVERCSGIPALDAARTVTSHQTARSHGCWALRIDDYCTEPPACAASRSPQLPARSPRSPALQGLRPSNEPSDMDISDPRHPRPATGPPGQHSFAPAWPWTMQPLSSASGRIPCASGLSGASSGGGGGGGSSSSGSPLLQGGQLYGQHSQQLLQLPQHQPFRQHCIQQRQQQQQQQQHHWQGHNGSWPSSLESSVAACSAGLVPAGTAMGARDEATWPLPHFCPTPAAAKAEAAEQEICLAATIGVRDVITNRISSGGNSLAQ